MKNKHFILLFVLGFIFLMIGALMKIYHFKIGILSGNHLLIMGLGIKFVAGLFFLIKIISSNENDWLNK